MRIATTALILSISMLSVLFFSGCQMLTGASTTTTSKKNDDPPEQYSNEVQVIVIIGQSNAEGTTHTQYLSKTVGEEKAALYAEGFGDVLISYKNSITSNTSNGEFVPVRTGQGHSKAHFGPEVGMAELISAQDLEKPVYIIKYTYGGTTLMTDWRPPSAKNPGRLYTGAVEYILEQCAALESMDLYPIIKAICWDQGGSDANLSTYVNYESLQEWLVEDLRNDLAYYKPAQSEIGFINAGISDCIPTRFYREINEAKKAVADRDEYHDYFSVIDEGLKYNAEPAGNPDIYHYDSKSMIELGHIFAQILLSKYLE